MSSRTAARRHAAASPKKSAATPVPAVQSEVRVDAAANDDTPKSDFSILGDPLWGMAIGTGILFAVLAALIALS